MPALSSAIVGSSAYVATDLGLERGLDGLATVDFVASGISAADSVLSASDDTIAVSATSRVQLEVRDSSGNPIASAAGIATLETYKEEGLFERAAARPSSSSRAPA